MGCESGRLTRDEMKLALQMARRTLKIALSENRLAGPEELGVPASGIFREKRAVFVTLKKQKALRGCIGHVLPVEELWQSIRSNAVSAALNDSRFNKVTAQELGSLDLDVSVLTVPEGIPDLSGYDVAKHGVILELGHRRALFLPQVAVENNWDRDTTLTYLSLKAGLPPDGWRNPSATFKVFEAQVFSEHDFPVE